MATQFPDLEHRTLTVHGKEAPFPVRVLRV
jgi:hypothetical protein